ncbi:T9SS type A sorting domain-containing protein [Algoriphagus namhaensis]|uniref:T9SS type A sorting domain-containing protein n=1 Tax=Algoriphagus namhaensis TaxID=915353 RepID=A0ABV8AN13_9BACT
MIPRILLCLCFFASSLAWGQERYSLQTNVEVWQDDQKVNSPFSGGVNSAQIQTLDLTGDGVEEWVIWDINSRQLQVFAKDGDQFTHLPELSYAFPEDINGFLVIKDFDGDGKGDLFTSTALGIKVYKNTSVGNNPSFEIASPVLRLDTGPNIQANNLDTPLLQDLDSDGDLDLIIFNFASGDFLEFYKNTSIERKGVADIDGFKFPVSFWGEFVFCACAEFSFGATCEGLPISQNSLSDPNARILHAGGHSILYEDFDGDGLSDLLLGRDECDILYFLPNKGTEVSPVFDEFQTELPGYGSLPAFQRFHVGRLIGDDLIISLNTNESSFNFTIDFAESIVRLDGSAAEATPVLQDQNFDLGENTRPFFRGNKSSGNLWLSYNTTTASGTQSELASLSLSNGILTVKENVEPSLSNLRLLDAQYLEFVDQQGINHQIVSGIRYENSIPTQQLFRFDQGNYMDFDLSGYSPSRGDYLQFFEYSAQDYMLVAARNGSLSLYSIDFATQSSTLLEEDFLNFRDNPANRNLFVAVWQKENPDLYTSDQLGRVIHIPNFMESELREEIQIEIGNQLFPTRLGRINALTVIPPLFSEAPDLLLGSSGGGLIYLTGSNTNSPGEGEYLLKIFPNPSTGPIKILSNRSAKGRIVTAMGQVLLDDIEILANQELQIQGMPWTPGLYILQVSVDDEFLESRKFYIQ